MRRLAIVAVGIAIIFSMTSTVLADEEADVQNLVEKAVVFFQQKGQDYALRVLNLNSGPFRKGELYVFAGSMKDFTFLAHPANPELLGKPQKDMKDAKGKLIFQEFVNVAKDPGVGWIQVLVAPTRRERTYTENDLHQADSWNRRLLGRGFLCEVTRRISTLPVRGHAASSGNGSAFISLKSCSVPIPAVLHKIAEFSLEPLPGETP